MVGQLAKAKGARAVGIAGGKEKCDYAVKELGFDACVSHLSPTFPEDLKAACPDGIDAYFENVGGAVFAAVLPLFNPGARMTICGLIAHYGDDPSVKAGLEERRRAEAAGVTVRNLAVGDYVASHHDRMLAEMGPWVASGQVKYREDIRQGLETLPAAFAEMLGAFMTLWNERQQMTSPGMDPANRDPFFGSLNHGLVSGIAGDLTNVSGSAPFDASSASVEFRKFYAETMGNDKLSPSEKQAALRKNFSAIILAGKKIELKGIDRSIRIKRRNPHQPVNA